MGVRRLWIVLAAGLAILAGRTAGAAEVQSLVPADALGYAVVHNLATADGKVGQLVQLTHLPIPQPLAMLQAMGGAKAGVDAAGTAAVVVLPGADPQAAPGSVLLLPVTDYSALVDPLKPEKLTDELAQVRLPAGTFVVAHRENFAVVAGVKDRAALEKLLSATEFLPEEPAALRDWLAGQDVAVVVTRPGVELLAAKATQALQEFRKGFEAVQAQAEKNAPEGFDRKQFEIMRDATQMYDAMIDAARSEVAEVGLGVRVDEEQVVRLSVPVIFRPEGTLASRIDTFKAEDGDVLAGLPQGQYMMAMGGMLPQDCAAAMGKASMSLLRFAPQIYGLSGEQIDRLKEIAPKYMEGVRGMAMVFAIGEADEPLYARTVGIMRVDDSAAFLARYDSYVEEMRKAIGDDDSTLFSGMTVEPYELDGKKGVKLTMNLPKMFPAGGPVDMSKVMDRMYGPGGKLSAYMVPADAHTVLFAYFGDDVLRRGLAAFEGKAGTLIADEQVAKTLKLLPAGAPAYGLWDLDGTRAYIQRTMEIIFSVTGQEIPPITIPELPTAPPVGVSLESAPACILLQVVVPPETIRAAVEYAGKLQQGLVPPQPVPTDPKNVL